MATRKPPRDRFTVVDVWSQPDSGDLEAMFQWCLYTFPPKGQHYDDEDNLPSDRRAYIGRTSWTTVIQFAWSDRFSGVIPRQPQDRTIRRFLFTRKKDATLFKLFWADHVIPTQELP